MAKKKFPNGFQEWQETHFEIVQAITIEHMKNNPQGIVKERHEAQGHGGLYELAEELTDKFEKKYEGKVWDGDFFEEIEAFIASEITRDIKETFIEPPKENEPSVWDFVVKWYPDFDHSNDIARADDLQKILDGEINGAAERIFNEEYGSDFDNPQIEIDYKTWHHDIYVTAIENFVKHRKP